MNTSDSILLLWDLIYLSFPTCKLKLFFFSKIITFSSFNPSVPRTHADVRLCNPFQMRLSGGKKKNLCDCPNFPVGFLVEPEFISVFQPQACESLFWTIWGNFYVLFAPRSVCFAASHFNGYISAPAHVKQSQARDWVCKLWFSQYFLNVFWGPASGAGVFLKVMFENDNEECREDWRDSRSCLAGSGDFSTWSLRRRNNLPWIRTYAYCQDLISPWDVSK